MEDLAGLRLPSPVVEVDDERLRAAGVRVLVKRDDLIHPEVPGDKWRKLKYNIATARDLGFETLLTFGGAYSNHIQATAAVGPYFGFSTVGVIRGEEHLPLNSSLQYAVSRGMRLAYLDRTTYRAKTSAAVIEALHEEFGDFYLIPREAATRTRSAVARSCRPSWMRPLMSCSVRLVPEERLLVWLQLCDRISW
ncbi:1-aminocyclopropane-1-carboxylate deaminase/D-cysteine desulfhydrase [Kribbella pittospori]|uniref:1-aminocyclopropane-1-carboxylate deaminase/D-cysteine desulfhydrase n=1 Tax=Kribbella pittospori TaxID=722689 RepID=UPI002357A8C9|nr:hypothetical protein [Kribbella pittospori]